MTPRQRQIMLFINDAIATTGVSPTSGDVAREIGFSRFSARKHLRVLEKEGFLRRSGGGGRRYLTLEVASLPGGDLTVVELAWCRANPDRVRAMMAVSGELTAGTTNPVAATLKTGPSEREARSAGIRALESVSPGGFVYIELPPRLEPRKRAYSALSMLAKRRWGKGNVRRRSTQDGVELHRLAPAVSEGGPC